MVLGAKKLDPAIADLKSLLEWLAESYDSSKQTLFNVSGVMPIGEHVIDLGSMVRWPLWASGLGLSVPQPMAPEIASLLARVRKGHVGEAELKILSESWQILAAEMLSEGVSQPVIFLVHRKVSKAAIVAAWPPPSKGKAAFDPNVHFQRIYKSETESAVESSQETTKVTAAKSCGPTGDARNEAIGVVHAKVAAPVKAHNDTVTDGAMSGTTASAVPCGVTGAATVVTSNGGITNQIVGCNGIGATVNSHGGSSTKNGISAAVGALATHASSMAASSIAATTQSAFVGGMVGVAKVGEPTRANAQCTEGQQAGTMHTFELCTDAQHTEVVRPQVGASGLPGLLPLSVSRGDYVEVKHEGEWLTGILELVKGNAAHVRCDLSVPGGVAIAPLSDVRPAPHVRGGWRLLCHMRSRSG